MVKHPPESTLRQIARYLLGYLVWIGQSALAAWAGLQLRAAAIELVTNRGSFATAYMIDRWLVILLGITWVVVVAVLREMMQTAVAERRLLRWSRLVIAVEVALLLCAYGLYRLA